MDFTAASHNPPNVGDLARMKFQSIPSLIKKSQTALDVVAFVKNLATSFSILLVLTKFVALSEYVTEHLPRRTMNLFKVPMNAYAVNAVTNSNWIAFTAIQIKTAM